MISLTHLPSTVGWRAVVLIKMEWYRVKGGGLCKKGNRAQKNRGIVLHRLYLHRKWIIIINNRVLVSGCHGHDYDHPVGL